MVPSPPPQFQVDDLLVDSAVFCPVPMRRTDAASLGVWAPPYIPGQDMSSWLHMKCHPSRMRIVPFVTMDAYQVLPPKLFQVKKEQKQDEEQEQQAQFSKEIAAVLKEAAHMWQQRQIKKMPKQPDYAPPKHLVAARALLPRQPDGRPPAHLLPAQARSHAADRRARAKRNNPEKYIEYHNDKTLRKKLRKAVGDIDDV